MRRLFAYTFALVIIAVPLALQARKHFDMPGDSSTASASIEAAAGDNEPAGCHSTAEPVATPAPAAVSSAPAPSASNAEEVKSGDMQLIHGCRFLMGTDVGLPVEAPVHQVTVKDFWIDRYAVTVAQFEKFAVATGYKTESEKLGWAGVFDVQASSWKRVAGADWRHPEGPASVALPAEPVTQVSWNDAAAYATWANKRLPTEAEFEYAARGGLIAKKYAWGDELTPADQYRANWWQGRFPDRNTGADGFIGRAPVGSFPPNGYGLYDMTGNVWEWCADWFGEEYYRSGPDANPQGPASGQHRVIRGGSWLCSDNYCTGYRVAARNHTAPDTGLNNLGFRCVRDR